MKNFLFYFALFANGFIGLSLVSQNPLACNFVTDYPGISFIVVIILAFISVVTYPRESKPDPPYRNVTRYKYPK